MSWEKGMKCFSEKLDKDLLETVDVLVQESYANLLASALMRENSPVTTLSIGFQNISENSASKFLQNVICYPDSKIKLFSLNVARCIFDTNPIFDVSVMLSKLCDYLKQNRSIKLLKIQDATEKSSDFYEKIALTNIQQLEMSFVQRMSFVQTLPESDLNKLGLKLLGNPASTLKSIDIVLLDSLANPPFSFVELAKKTDINIYFGVKKPLCYIMRFQKKWYETIFLLCCAKDIPRVGHKSLICTLGTDLIRRMSLVLNFEIDFDDNDSSSDYHPISEDDSFGSYSSNSSSSGNSNSEEEEENDDKEEEEAEGEEDAMFYFSYSTVLPR